MDKLLNPDTGLLIWTVIVFIGVVFVLGRFAWKPLLQALEAREEKIRSDIKSADDARRAAEELKTEYDRRLAEVEVKTRELLLQAQKAAGKIKEDLLKTAQEEASRISEKTRQQLAEEQRRLVQELRAEVAEISVKTAEKLLRHSVDKSVQDKFVKEALSDFEKLSKGER